MSARLAWSVIAQRAREHPGLTQVALLGLMARGSLEAVLRRRRRAFTTLSQVHRSSRAAVVRRLVEPFIIANREVAWAPPPASSPAALAAHFGARMAVLKEPTPGERGVVFVMFTELLRMMFAAMDVRRLAADYTIVVEPSWSGYCDEDFLRFTQLGEEVFVLAAQHDDFTFLQRLRSNLVPVPLGPCDWVDPRVAEPFLANPKEYDIVMNGHWGASKRHHVLFRFLRSASRRYEVLLIGGPWEGRTMDDVQQLARHYGVAGQVTFCQRLPYATVMDLTCRARLAVLLSLKEGSNRAIAESLFCNVPVLVLSSHVGGIVKNVVPETGALVPERELGAAIERLLAEPRSPRAWAVRNISCFESTGRLNEILRRHAHTRGLPWTRDIAPRSNSPESRYVSDADARRLAPWNAALATYLAPAGPAA